MKKLAFGTVFLLLSCPLVFAWSLGEADYVTPESWSQHFSPNGIVKSLRNTNLGGGEFNFNLTSRYKLGANYYSSDQDFYQYVRAGYTGLKLGEGTFSANLFMRVGKDLDGNYGRQWGDNRYYFYDDILDVESINNDWAARFYQGNIVFDNVLEGTKFTLGRQYAEHINNFQIDGANIDLSFLDDKLGIFVYGGLPVSYFVDTLSSWLVGGGLSYSPIDSLKLRGEFTYSDILDDASYVVKVRADWVYEYGYLYGQYGNVDGGSFYELGTVFRYNPTKTAVSLSFEQLIDKIGDSTNYFTNPMSYALSPYGQYIKAKLRLEQGITDYLVAGVGVEYKNAYGVKDWDNRDYTRYFANLDLVRLPFEGTYLSLMVDYWDINASENTGRNNEVTFGAELTQVLAPNADLWVGTTFNRFQFDAETGEYKDWVRSYYAGVQWKISKIFATTVDFTYEDSQLLRKEGNSLVNNFLVQFWLNIAL